MHSLLPCLATSVLLFGTDPQGVKGPDSVKLVKNGTVQEGRVVFEGKDEIILRTERKDLHIARADIAEIHSVSYTHLDVYKRQASLSA